MRDRPIKLSDAKNFLSKKKVEMVAKGRRYMV
jgi:hypothetical protein